MTPFTTQTGPAAPFPESDVDTDVIFPARFLLLLDRVGLGKHLFHERRFDRSGALKPDFILNRPPFDRSQILVAGRNFGAGSSREQAVWTLADFGIRCVIAASFGEIFFANCFKNGVLPIILKGAAIERVQTAAATGTDLTVDLESQLIVLRNGVTEPFAIDPHRRAALLAGLDEIGEVLSEDSGAIDGFEETYRVRAPWMFLDAAILADLKEGEEL